jgi:hypothetical protein
MASCKQKMTCLLNETWHGEGVIDENNMAINARGAEHCSTDHAWAFFFSSIFPPPPSHIVSDEDKCRLLTAKMLMMYIRRMKRFYH